MTGLVKKINFPSENRFDFMTVEERAAAELDYFRIDAGLTASSIFGAVLCERLTKLVDMVRLSAKSEWREKYQLLHNYAADPDTLSAAYSIERERKRYESNIWTMMKELSSASQILQCIRSKYRGDGGDRFMDRVDIGEEIFAPHFKELSALITSALRPYKISDPKMIYFMVQTILFAMRFNALNAYIKSLSPTFTKGGYLNDKIRINVIDHLHTLAHRCQFSCKDGSIVRLNFTTKDEEEWSKLTSKLSWQKKNADKTYTVIDMRDLLHNEDIYRATWKMETHLLEIETIDHIVLQSEGFDPEYRNDYSMKRVQSCCTTYEQAMLNTTIFAGNWYDFPRRMNEYIQSRKAFVRGKRSPKPVVGFSLSTIKDKSGKENIKASFFGIWNSSLEAQKEMGVDWHIINHGLKKKKNDGKNHLWFTLEEYCTKAYTKLQQDYPEEAAECMRLFPEYIKTK